MSTESIEDRLEQIQQQLSVITDEIEASRRQRQEMQELKNDLAMIARDVFNTTVVEMEDIAPFVNSGDFWFLFKKVLRNTRTISESLSRIESTVDFTEDLLPIGHEVFSDILRKLDEMDREGYFEFLRSLTQSLDKIIKSIDIKDLNRITEKVILPGLDVLRKLADMDFIGAVDRTVGEFTTMDAEAFDRFSKWEAFRRSKKREMKRATGRTLYFLEILARETNRHNDTKETKDGGKRD